MSNYQKHLCFKEISYFEHVYIFTGNKKATFLQPVRINLCFFLCLNLKD